MYEERSSQGSGSLGGPVGGGVPGDDSAAGRPVLGDVVPVPPGAVDRVRLARVLAEMDEDPWFDEDWYQPTAEEEEEIFLIDHPELAGPPAADPPAVGSDADVAASAAPQPANLGASAGTSGLAADGIATGAAEAAETGPGGNGWVPDDRDDPVAAARWHPDVRVPARLPDVEQMPGSPELAARLAGAELSGLGAYELVEYVAGCERVASAMLALQARGVAELMRRQQMRPLAGARATVDPARITALEVAARLARSSREGDALVARAGYLTAVLPDTFAAWSAGVIDTEKADLIGRKLGRLDDGLARRVEAAVLGEAPAVTVDTLRRLIARAIQRLDPKNAEQRHRRAHRDRFVRITPVDDGMAWIEAYVSAADAAAVKAVLDAGAAALKKHDQRNPGRADHPGPGPDGSGTAGGTSTGAFAGAEDTRGDGGGEGRSMANRRADVLTSLAWAALAAGRIGGCTLCRAGLKLQDAHQRPVTVNLTMPATGLLGLTDEPAELAGYGPIPAAVARELAGNALWRRILTDPASGTVLDVGRTRYRPPADLAEHILLRDGTCIWPGCDRPATGPGIDIDHLRAWVDGGLTADHNLGPFCERHHTEKHETDWQVSQPQPGRFEFTSPTGHTYTREPVRTGPIVAVPTDPDPPERADADQQHPPAGEEHEKHDPPPF